MSSNIPEEIPESEEQTTKPLEIWFSAVDTNVKPDLQDIQTAILKSGPRSQKVVKFAHIRDRHTGEVHHAALSIQTYRISKGQQVYDSKHTISLSSEGEDEIQKLYGFLQTVLGQEVTEHPAATTNEQAAEPSTEGKAEIVAELLQKVSGNEQFLAALLDRVHREPQLFAEAAAAINLATYKTAIDELIQLITSADRVLESQFQKLLSENPWMFGSEYSEILDRRRWTRDENQDFVVRRTSDDYIELIEIKTPLGGTPLFRYDESHDSYYAGADLSKVLGQVQNYLEKLDADRYAIQQKDSEDVCKIRAKIIVGRDGDAGQQQALRRLNGHLHRIEVLTFDQLLHIAQRVVSYLENALRPAN